MASHFSLALISYGIGHSVPNMKQLIDELSYAGFKNITVIKLLPGSDVYGISALNI
jgi:hypothetical protein